MTEHRADGVTITFFRTENIIGSWRDRDLLLATRARGYFGFLDASRLNCDQHWLLSCGFQMLIVKLPPLFHHQLFPIPQFYHNFSDPFWFCSKNLIFVWSPLTHWKAFFLTAFLTLLIPEFRNPLDLQSWNKDLVRVNCLLRCIRLSLNWMYAFI